MYFFIAEVDDGFTILECDAEGDPAAVAVKAGGTLVDPGPFTTYEQANDALIEFEEDVHQRDPGAARTPPS